MRKVKIISVLLAGFMAFACFAGCGKKTEIIDLNLSQRNAYRGEQLFKSTMDKYFDADEKLCYQYYSQPDVTEDTTVASVWHYSSLHEAAVYYLQTFPQNSYAKDSVKAISEGLEYYAERRDDGIPVYGLYRQPEVATNPKNKSLYDDNSCIIRNQIQQSVLTDDKDLMENTKKTMKYITDNGWDKSINSATGEEWGGNDQGPASANYYKPICANEYTAMDLLTLYELETDAAAKAEYLALGKKYYDWSVKTFRLDNNLYGDYIGVERLEGKTVGHGVVALDMYTYHQGSMIEDGVRMYKATADEKYLTQAKETAIASRAFFGRRDIIEGMYQLPFNIYHWFNISLLRGYMMLAKIDAEFKPFVDEIQASIDYAYDNFYRDGLLPVNFLQGWIEGNPFDENMNVMDASAYAQYYFMLSEYYA